MDKIEKNINTFMLYNECIGVIKGINKQYNEDNKEISEIGVYSALYKAKNLDNDTYLKIMEYIINNNLYEKYSKPILELNYNYLETSKQETQTNNNNNQNSKPKENNNNSNIKTQTNNDINEMFIKRLYEDNEDN